MKLYYSPGACSLASHITALEADIPLELEKVDLKAHKTETGEDYFKINPKGSVPALRLDDGTLLTENVAVLPYLADIKPGMGLAPPPKTLARAQLREWLGYLSSEIHKSFGPIFRGGSEAECANAREAIGKRLDLVDSRLTNATWLMGDAFTVADAYLFVMLTWLDKTGIAIGQFALLPSYRDRIASRPAVRHAMREEGLG